MNRVRLGILGAGNIADLNVAGYLSHPACDVVAVCDIDPIKAAAAAKRSTSTPWPDGWWPLR